MPAPTPDPPRPVPPKTRPAFMNWRLVLPITGWLGLTAAGFWALQRFDFTPGPTAPAAETYRLVLFAHPHCPCTRAALVELADLVETADGRLTAEVVFVGPDQSAAAADRVRGAAVGFDDGRRAHAAGARTSGHVVLYGPAGDVRFSGGITPSRGHPGPNPGRAAVQAVVRGEPAPVRTAPVFGCPLGEFSADERSE